MKVIVGPKKQLERLAAVLDKRLGYPKCHSPKWTGGPYPRVSCSCASPANTSQDCIHRSRTHSDVIWDETSREWWFIVSDKGKLIGEILAAAKAAVSTGSVKPDDVEVAKLETEKEREPPSDASLEPEAEIGGAALIPK